MAGNGDPSGSAGGGAEAGPPGPTLLGAFLGELRRRRVFRALAVYSIVAFAILQVVEPVMHGLHLPDWVISFVVVLLALGFPVAIGLAWAFDLKTTGVERTPPAQRPPGAPRRSRVRVALLLLGLSAAAGGAVFALRAWLRPPAPPPSIAVLPFADMSPQKDQEYFADGVAEEILNALAQVQGLKVIGRTSSFSFKGKGDDLRTIGQKLDVVALLEGSVRKEGNRLRIAAQLVRAADGSHLWAQTFDRDQSGVFAVQEEIARNVVLAFKVRLTAGNEPTLGARTASPEAYNQYLLGIHFARQGSRDGFRRAEQAFRKAISIDPGYALAHVGVSSALAGRYNAGDSESAGETARLQEECIAAAERAVQLAPDLAEAYQARSMTRRRFMWDWQGARADVERALALERNNPEALWNHGIQLAILGHLPEGIASLEKATQVEPLSVEAWRWLGLVYMAAGERARARKALAQALEIAPEHEWALIFTSMDLLVDGRAAAALETMQRSQNEVWRLWGQAFAHHTLGNDAESRRALDEVERRWAHVGAYQVAEIYAWRGEREQALDWLERCYRDRDSGLILAGLDPLMRGLRGDGRYREIMRKLKLPAD